MNIKLLNLFKHKYYWPGFLLLSILLETIALFYQYVLEFSPCVLCIHVRIWVLAIFLNSIIPLLSYKNRIVLLVSNITMTVFITGLLERSYQLIGVERGFIDGGCSMDSGLPSWFALDEWFPIIFQVQEPCGYTPELLFGVTMAEALIVLSSVLLIISITNTVLLIAQSLKSNKYL
ncbi:MAG: disulfide bond formation protein B [Gammaproteobacteria bacterium]|nr:disulfide bond formation protein B [Gammaproteobacteria bacterium]